MIRAQLLEFFVIFITLCLSIGISFIISGASYTLGRNNRIVKKFLLTNVGLTHLSFLEFLFLFDFYWDSFYDF